MMWCFEACACFEACRFGDSSQQPTCPQVMHSRRWFHQAPSLMQSSQPSALGVTGSASLKCSHVYSIEVPPFVFHTTENAMSTRTILSPYMQHAKRPVDGLIRLDASGVSSPELDEPLRLELEADLRCNPAITVHGHYGYSPLLDALAEKCGLDSTDSIVTAAGSSM